MDKTLEAIRRRSGKGVERAAGLPEVDMLSAEDAVAQLRALMARIPDVVELTSQERENLRRSANMSESAINASIRVLQASSEVAQVVAAPEDVRRMHENDSAWDLFETELKAAWKLVSGTNVVRRQRTRLLAVQAYRVGQQLARTPGNANLAVHVNEVMRLRNLGRRRRAKTSEPTGENPAPSDPGIPSASEALDSGGSSNTK